MLVHHLKSFHLPFFFIELTQVGIINSFWVIFKTFWYHIQNHKTVIAILLLIDYFRWKIWRFNEYPEFL